MHTTNLRKVGGSVMLAVPPALLDILHLQPGATVGIGASLAMTSSTILPGRVSSFRPPRARRSSARG